MMLYIEIECLLVSCMGLVKRDHGVVLTDRVVTGLMNRVGEKRPWCCRQIEWSLVSCMGLVRRDHDVV